MKPNQIILMLCCFVLSLNLKANDEIKLTWPGGIYIGQGVTVYKKNITITAPENKTFTIDWGDGSTIETKTGTGDIQIINHTYADTKVYTATIRGSSADCLFTYFDCVNNGVMKLNMGSNVSLKTLRCRYNWLTELDISHCTALVYLDYSSNKLTELDISHCSALEYMDCSYNLLKELYISTNSALKYLDCRGNGFGNTDGGITHLYINNCELTYLDCSHNLNSTHKCNFSEQKIGF